MHALKEVVTYFKKADPAMVMAVDDTEEETIIPSAVMIPLKWAARMIEKHPYPNEFVEFIFKKTVGWSDTENKLVDYLIIWAVVACNLKNKTSGKAISQVGLQLPDINVVNKSINDWAEARLT